MQQLFSHLPNMRVTIDNIIIHANNLDDLRLNTDNVIDMIISNGKLNKEKCKFEQRKIKFLGHVISEAGLSPDPEKIVRITA